MISTGTEMAAEQSVLGAVFLEPDVLDEVTFLEERDFLIPKHKEIYKVMRFLEKRGKPVDIITVTEAYVKFGNIEKIGGVQYLSELAASCPTTANVKYYAEMIRSKAMERRIKNTAQIIEGMSRSDYESDEEFFSYVEQLVTELRPIDNAKMLSFSESREEYYTHLKTPAEFIKTGFSEYDKWAQGIWRGWLFVSAGRPSVGKTALALQRINGVAKQKEGVVLIWSQEMKRDSLKDRMISAETGIPFQRIKMKDLNQKEQKLVDMAYDNFEYLPIFMQDSSGVTIDEIKATAKQFKRKHGKIAMIVVDYLQIMNIPQTKGDTRALAIGRVTGQAKQIAMELNCCFMMLSQMTRDSDKGGIPRRPVLADLKESSSIEQDADVVEFLWSEGERTSQGKIINQTFAKGRDIGVNEFKLLFLNWKQKFTEVPREVKQA
ncbi:replicative DNA helicase [Peribacillus sp. JNUCC41]|uniref:replicative DNA helicase n=1 Tax=Peribacillus sp. JNUCC41 TaxID=2778370 RepID=UPI00177ECD94|nr:DnaB-like helicase C-terminal domain-containing protein [Brevibacillus sp. JNUCC-41]QOS90238.1 AAA family ATPase [Brevibacillus sp. JNUCC-41]